jgi:hypothetical protein
MGSGAKQSEFEDLVDPALYRERFQTEFNVDVNHPWTRQLSKGKWSKRMPAVFQASGVRWTDALAIQAKAAVANRVATEPQCAIRADCKGILDSVRDALEKKLEAREV